jgi:hypothetical protein
MAAAVDCISAGVLCMRIDLGVLGRMYTIANIERRLAIPSAHASFAGLPAANGSHNRSV